MGTSPKKTKFIQNIVIAKCDLVLLASILKLNTNKPVDWRNFKIMCASVVGNVAPVNNSQGKLQMKSFALMVQEINYSE